MREILEKLINEEISIEECERLLKADTILEFDEVAKDNEKPVITLNKANTIYIGAGSKYEEPGFVANDNCDGIITDKVKVTGNVDTSKEGTYELTYSVSDLFGNTSSVKRTIKVFSKNAYNPENLGNKVIYLTFDDGPSVYTKELLNILKEYNAKRIMNDLGNVIIIGGGNVATDSARAAIRMGAKSSTIVYRRNREKMPAREIELEEAMEDGVEVIYNTKVLEADVEEGKIQKVRCIKTDTTNGEVKDIEGSEFYINADTIIFAIKNTIGKWTYKNRRKLSN